MDVAGRKVENQVQFWSLLGPFFLLLSIAVLVIKTSPHWYFPLSALVGIPLCLKWKMKGMAAALGCLFLLSTISYFNLDLDDRYWHVGLSLAMAFSFIVLTLSLEEAQGLVGKLELESKSRLDNFLLLDEKWNVAEQEWKKEREELCSKSTAMTNEMNRISDEKQTFYKLAQLAKDELIQVRVQHARLLQDLFYKKELIAQLRERLDDAELTIQGFVDTDSEKRNATLTARIAVLESEKEHSQENIERLQEINRSCKEKREQLERDLSDFEKSALVENRRNQIERNDFEIALEALQTKCKDLELLKLALLIDKKSNGAELIASQLIVKKLETELNEAKGEIKTNNNEFILLHEKADHLSQELSIERSLVAQSDAQNKEKETKINTLDLIVQSAENKLEEAKEDLREKNALIGQMQSKLNQFSQDLSHQSFLLEQSMIRKNELESLTSKLEDTVQKIQSEMQKEKEKIHSSEKHRDKLPYAPGNHRQIEAMYIQLKQQFEEKCDILNATRKELFIAHEQLLKFQNDYVEEKTFDLSYEEKLLMKHIESAEENFVNAEKLYIEEIENLEEIVGHLLSQIIFEQNH